MQIERKSYPVELYTATHKIEGTYQPIGHLIDDINHEDKVTIPLLDATFSPLAPSTRMRPVSVPTVSVSRSEVLFCYFKEEKVADELRMLRRTEPAILYTASFALRGDMHLGAEQQFRDMFDTMRGHFQVLTDVTIFPLIETKVNVPRQARLLLFDITKVLLYHPEVAS